MMDNYKIPKLHKNVADVSTENNFVFSFQTHTHSYYEMILYEAFDGEIGINNTIFYPTSTTAILIIPSDFHKITVAEKRNAKFIKISFDADILGEDFSLNNSLILKDIEPDSFLPLLFKEIHNAYKNSAYQKHLIKTAAFTLNEKGEKILPLKNTGSSNYVKKAIKIVNENFSEEISLFTVAKQLSISPQYLSTIFKDNLGINFSKYLNEIRLYRASKLLTETNENITDICEICGYRNLSHFLRCFKSKFGCSPTIYRKTNSK